MFRLNDARPLLGGLILDAFHDLKDGDSINDFHVAIRGKIRQRYRGPWADFLMQLIDRLPEIAEFIAMLFELFSARQRGEQAEPLFGSTDAKSTRESVTLRGQVYYIENEVDVDGRVSLDLVAA